MQDSLEFKGWVCVTLRQDNRRDLIIISDIRNVLVT